MSVTAGDPAPPTRRVGAVRALFDRFRGLVHELGKFGTVGGVAYLIDLVLFNIGLEVLDLETLTAKTLSTAIAATAAFVGNRFWTWRHRERSGLAREYGLYFVFNAIGLGIGLLTLATTHYGLGSVWPAFQSTLADNISANVVGVVLGTGFRFWSYRRFVFPAAVLPPAETPSTVTATATEQT